MTLRERLRYELALLPIRVAIGIAIVVLVLVGRARYISFAPPVDS